MRKQKIIALIPARGDSKGIPRKNVKLLADKPLITYTIEAAKKSRFLDRIIVSTEDSEIKEISMKCGAEVIKRPAELATDTTKTQDVVKHAFEFIKGEAEFVVLLQPTSPFRTTETIDSAIKQFIDKKEKYDSLISVKKLRLKTGTTINGQYIQNNKGEVRRQDLDDQYYECGTIFIYKADLLKQTNIYGKTIMPFIIESSIEAIDIETIEDFKIAEALMVVGHEKSD